MMKLLFQLCRGFQQVKRLHSQEERLFCDIDPKTYTLDTNKIKSKITSRTVGIIPVHLYGHPSEMDEIQELALKHGLWIIEGLCSSSFCEV